MHKVFVYGSLKKDFPKHKLLAAQKFLGEFTTAEAIYDMENVGIYPGVREKGSHYIQGEIYAVDDQCLVDLDTLEENGKTYARKLVQIANFAEPCWMYFILEDAKIFKPKFIGFEVVVNQISELFTSIASWEKSSISI